MSRKNPAAAHEVARLLERVPAVLSYWDATQRCRFCNQASTRWWGLPPESVVGKHASALLGPLYPLNLPHIERVLQGEPQQFEREIPDPNGGPARSSLINYTPEIVDGSVRGFFVLVTDVSDAKRTQLELRASEAHLKQILDTAATGLTRCSRDLRYVSANRAYAEIVGLPLDQIVGHPIEEVLGRETLEAVRPYIDRVLSGETVEYEVEVPLRLGGHRYSQVVGTPWKEPDGSVSGWVSSVTDVSGRKRAEIAYRTSDERYRLLLEATAVGTWDEDMHTGQAIWNAQAFHIFGRTPQSEPVTAEAWSTRVHPDDRERVGEAYQRARADGSLYQCEHRILRLDGSVRWIAPYGRFLLDSSGRAQRFVGVFRDVTEHRQSLEAQARLAAIVNSSSDAIFSETLDGIITSWNPGAKRIFGYAAEEIIGQSINQLVPVDRQQEKEAMLMRAARGEATDSIETTRLCKDGTTVSVSLTMSPVEDAQNRIVGASTIARDITDRELAQAALRASEERQRALIGAIPQMVWTCDSQGHCEFVNSQWLEYSGLSLQQCVSRTARQRLCTRPTESVFSRSGAKRSPAPRSSTLRPDCERPMAAIAGSRCEPYRSSIATDAQRNGSVHRRTSPISWLRAKWSSVSPSNCGRVIGTKMSSSPGPVNWLRASQPYGRTNAMRWPSDCTREWPRTCMPLS